MRYRMLSARTLRWPLAAITLSLLAACGGEPVADTAAGTVADAATSAPTAAAAPSSEAALVEPTEDEMRALQQARIDDINRKGGIVIEMSGARSAPIKMKLESFRKIGCKPYTRAFRCEGESRTSYPGSELPAETLSHSDRYRKDDQGRWTTD